MKTAVVGRRQRNMEDKRARILAAARRLMMERGFDGVTTQEISDAAGVAAGTLFRYASSKGELLLMVLNHEFEAATKLGNRLAADVADPEAAVWALVQPVLRFADSNPEITTVYQRELLFGPVTQRFRAEGLEQVSHWQASVAGHLSGLDRSPLSSAVAADAALAARSVFAVLHLAISSPVSGPDRSDNLRRQITQIIDGFSRQARAREGTGNGIDTDTADVAWGAGDRTRPGSVTGV